MEVYERIKARRKELGLSADNVANALGVSRATIYRYESADIEKLPTTIIEPLAKILQCSIAYLMGWEENINIYGENFQDIIRKRRLDLDLTLKDVAKALGVAEATVSRYETGDIQNMGIDKIAKLAKVLRCSPGYLMGWEESPNNTYKNDFQLSELEKDIIRKFRTLNNGERAMFLRTIGVEEKEIVERMA